MAAPTGDINLYEQPLNERIRTLLRLEHLFLRASHHLPNPNTWSSRATIDALMDIMALMGRSDLKTELIKELERHSATLEGLEKNPRVDAERLHHTLDEIHQTREILYNAETAPGQPLRENELLASVRQRDSIPAGSCAFDLPGYNFWLRHSPERRLHDLTTWLSCFDALRLAVSMCLKLVRESAISTDETAISGFFQRTLDRGTPYQLLRVGISIDANWYPEISAGKHRFSVRFLEQNSSAKRPIQTEEDVDFQLHCCGL